MKIEFDQIKNELNTNIKSIMKNEPYLCILYGGFKQIYDESTDVDVCIYAEVLTIEQRIKIAKEIEELHIRYGLKIDSDMKYINKTSFSRDDIEMIKSAPPFPQEKGLIVLAPVTFEREFLDSQTMRLRLLINILTTNGILLYGNMEDFAKLTGEMYEILLSIVKRTTHETLSQDDILNKLLWDDTQGCCYKGFLGYDPEDASLCRFLRENIGKYLKK